MHEFINAAEHSRKYLPNTASAYRSALRLFESELSEDEKESLDLLQERLDHIYHLVVGKNNQKMTMASLETYRRRFINLLKDYEAYGIDPTKMNTWERKVRNIRRAKRPIKVESSSSVDISSALLQERTEMNRLELSLRPGVKAIMVIPPDITKQEASMIKAIIDAHVAETEG